MISMYSLSSRLGDMHVGISHPCLCISVMYISNLHVQGEAQSDGKRDSRNTKYAAAHVYRRFVTVREVIEGMAS